MLIQFCDCPNIAESPKIQSLNSWSNSCTKLITLDIKALFTCGESRLYKNTVNCQNIVASIVSVSRTSVSIWGFFHLTFTNHRVVRGGVRLILTPLYHPHTVHEWFGISWAITGGSSSLCIACDRTRTGNLWFLSTGH